MLIDLVKEVPVRLVKAMRVELVATMVDFGSDDVVETGVDSGTASRVFTSPGFVPQAMCVTVVLFASIRRSLEQ